MWDNSHIHAFISKHLWTASRVLSTVLTTGRFISMALGRRRHVNTLTLSITWDLGMGWCWQSVLCTQSGLRSGFLIMAPWSHPVSYAALFLLPQPGSGFVTRPCWSCGVQPELDFSPTQDDPLCSSLLTSMHLRDFSCCGHSQKFPPWPLRPTHGSPL